MNPSACPECGEVCGTAAGVRKHHKHVHGEPIGDDDVVPVDFDVEADGMGSGPEGRDAEFRGD